MTEYISRNKKMVFFCLVVVVNLCVKLLGITYNQIALDEPFSIYHAQFSIGHIYHTLIQGNNPPLYEIFLHYWIDIFGTDVFWVRLPSVIFSSFASGFWFLTALHGMSLLASVGVATLLTFSTQYVYFSHEARAYAMLLMFLGLTSYLVIKIWKGEKSYITIFAAAFFSALCVYVHYLAVIPVGLMAVLILIKALKDKRLFVFIFSLGLLLIPIGILILDRMKSIDESGIWGIKPSWTQLYGYLNIFLNGRITLAVVAICLLVGGILFIRQKEKISNKNEWQFVLIWGVIFSVGYLCMFIVSYKHPIFIERYVQVIMPFFFLSLAALFSMLFHKIKFGKIAGLFVLLVFCGQVNLYPSNDRNPQKVALSAKDFMGADATDKAVCMVPAWYQYNFAYYFDQSTFQLSDMDNLSNNNIFPINDFEMGSLLANGSDAVQPYPNVLYIDSGEFFATGNNDILNMFLLNYDLQKKDSVDKQTTLYYLHLKQD